MRQRDASGRGHLLIVQARSVPRRLRGARSSRQAVVARIPRRGEVGWANRGDPVRDRGRLEPVRRVELAQDVRDMHAGGLDADHERGGDLAVGEAAGGERQYLRLARRQAKDLVDVLLKSADPVSGGARWSRARSASRSSSSATTLGRRPLGTSVGRRVAATRASSGVRLPTGRRRRRRSGRGADRVGHETPVVS
jgi:hypothetical protein